MVEEGEVCAVNIGPKERQKRMTFGIIMLVVGDILAGLLLTSRANRFWRMGLVLPYMLAGYGIFQARAKT